MKLIHLQILRRLLKESKSQITNMHSRVEWNFNVSSTFILYTTYSQTKLKAVVCETNLLI